MYKLTSESDNESTNNNIILKNVPSIFVNIEKCCHIKSLIHDYPYLGYRTIIVELDDERDINNIMNVTKYVLNEWYNIKDIGPNTITKLIKIVIPTHVYKTRRLFSSDSIVMNCKDLKVGDILYHGICISLTQNGFHTLGDTYEHLTWDCQCIMSE